MYISIHSLCSILCWCTFGSNYSIKAFWIWCHKHGTPIFGQFCPFLFAAPLKLHQVGWEASVHSHFSDLSRDFQSDSSLGSGWATQGHSQSCPEAPSLISWYLSCLLRVVVLLKDEPSPSVWGQEHSGAGFHPGCLCTLLHSYFPLSWLVSQFLSLKNIPTAWCCHHHASL